MESERSDAVEVLAVCEGLARLMERLDGPFLQTAEGTEERQALWSADDFMDRALDQLQQALEGHAGCTSTETERGEESMTTKMDEFLNQIRDAHGMLVRARVDASLDGPVTKDMDSVAAVLDGALTFASTWGLRGVEPTPELEAAGMRILEDIREVRILVSRILSHGTRTPLTTELANAAREKLNRTLREMATNRDPAALRAKLAELVSIRNVGGPISPEPYPGTVDDVADEIAVFVDELDYAGSARGLRMAVFTRLHDLQRQRVEQERRTMIATVLLEVTNDQLRPALAEIGVTLPEGYVLKWVEDDSVSGG